MGTPIKDRGIRWEEIYGDKSLYLKQQFEEQVGPGSYFRWEGHDSTSGADYYAVVTPGFSNNHGFHFFAALRKMPAKNGASGKKFKTQAEALSYAYDTWRVPPPKTKPHKPYIARDLEGKPIVTENVHDAASDVFMIKESMAFMSSAYAGDVFPNEGPKELYARMFQAGVTGLIMNRGAALNTAKQWQIADKYDQGPGGVFDPETNQSRGGVFTGLATCQPPSQRLWDAAMNPAGFPTDKRLIKVDRKAGKVEITPPRMPNAQNSPQYSVVRFDNIMNIAPTFRVGADKKPAFDALIQSVQADPNFRSKLKPEDQIAVMNETAPKKGVRGNHNVTVSMPVDLYKNFRALLDQQKLASPEKMRWEDDNAVELYSHFLKPENGGLATPEAIEQAKQTPVVEISRPSRGQLVIYDQRGYPVGLKIKQSRKYDQEAAGEGDVEDLFMMFANGQVDNLLQQAGGDPVRLREMLANNQIQLQREMFIDSRTAAPKNRHIWSMMPEIDDKGRPVTDMNGQIILKRRSLIDDYPMDAPGGKVRVFNPETNQEELQPIPQDVQPQQNVSGIPVIASGFKYHVPVQTVGPDGQPQTTWDEIDAGETRLYDPNSKGKFKNGPIFTAYVKPERASSKKSNKNIYEKEQDSLGFFVGYKKTLSDLSYRESGKIWDQHRPSLYSIITPDGKEMQFPDNPDANPNDPAIQYLNSGQPIKGYFYVTQRQFSPNPITASNNPTIQRREKRPDGTFGPAIDPATGQPADPLKIKDEDISTVDKGVTYFKSMRAGIDIMKATMGWDDDTVGRWTDYTIEDLHAADDRARDVRAKQARGEPLTPEEKIFTDFEQKGNLIPTSALAEFSAVTDNPAEYEPRKGTLYKIANQMATPGEQESIFVSKLKAEAHMQRMMATGEYPEGSLMIEEIQNADLMVSAFRRKQADPNAPSVVTQNFTPEENALDQEMAGEFGQEPAIPGDEEPAIPGDIAGDLPEIEVQPETQAPAAEVAQQAPQAAIPGDLENEFLAGPAIPDDMPAQMPTETPAPLEQEFLGEQSQQKPPIAFNPTQAPGATQEKDWPWSFALGPRKPDSRNAARRPQASKIQQLIKLANMLDDQGRIDEANAIDRLIKMTLQKNPETPEER